MVAIIPGWSSNHSCFEDEELVGEGKLPYYQIEELGFMSIFLVPDLSALPHWRVRCLGKQWWQPCWRHDVGLMSHGSTSFLRWGSSQKRRRHLTAKHTPQGPIITSYIYKTKQKNTFSSESLSLTPPLNLPFGTNAIPNISVWFNWLVKQFFS